MGLRGVLVRLFSDWLSFRYPEESPHEFYRALFPSGELERRGEYVDGKYCGIAVQVVGRNRAKRYSVTDDLGVIDSLVASDDFCIMSPVSYAGKTQRQEMARFLYAVTFDLDGVRVRDGEPVGLIDLLHQTTLTNAYALPVPTYIVSSGTGLHLYYLLSSPVPLFRNVIEQLARLRRVLTRKIWNDVVTTLSDNVQYESVTQGFRMVGTVTKDGSERVRAFRVGEPVTIEYLNSFVTENARVTTFAYKRNMSLDEAREKYPDWYERRVVAGKAPGSWTVKRDLYDWWRRKIDEGAVEGHRYFCIMALAIFAQKCAVPEDELVSDALGFIPLLNSRSTTELNPFTEADVMKALEAYNATYQTFPRHTIEELTAIPMPANKRNGRKQADHLRRARAVQAVDYPEGEWRNGDGAPTKEDAIRRYKDEHPGANNSEIARALGCSRTTVVKWLKGR